MLDPYEIAMVYVGLEENDTAIEWLESTYREHSMSVALFSSEPFLLKLHSDARFQELTRKAHLPTPPSLQSAIRKKCDQQRSRLISLTVRPNIAR